MGEELRRYIGYPDYLTSAIVGYSGTLYGVSRPINHSVVNMVLFKETFQERLLHLGR